MKELLCLLLVICILCSFFALPAYADNTISTNFNSLDQKKLQIAIDSLQEPYTEGTALVKDIYTHAFSYNFNIKSTVAEVLDQVFVNGYTDEEKAEDTASEGSSTVIVNVMNMIVPTLYSEIPESLSSYFNGEPALNPTSADLITGDLLLMEASDVCSIYIYNGRHLVKLVKPSLIRENADTVLTSALNADRYVVLRPSKELSAIHRTTDEELTLTDAQKAVIGTAEAYLLRGYRIQYDDCTPFTKNSYRWTTGLRTPEESSFDNIGFTNCAAFTADVYKTALKADVKFTTANLKWSSDTVWRYPADTSASIGGETEEQKAEIEADFYNNIQPGDIINIRYVKSKGGGHAMLYIGNGNIIHSGGYSYSFSTGDVAEASIKQMRVEELFDPANKRYVFSKLDSINLVRPLKSWSGTIPENTINRITTMKGIVGEKLSSKNRFSTVNPGNEITYTFRVFNSNDDEKILEIKDIVPENTTYVSGDMTNNNGSLSYSLTVPAYETKEVSYTVKVNENAQDGIWITSNDATISGVLHKTYEVPVRNTLTSAQQTAISEAIANNSSLASSTDKGIAYANKIYKDVLGVDYVLDHTDIADIKANLFPVIDENTVIEGVTVSNYLGSYYLDTTSHYGRMLVPRMFGGRRVVTELHADKITQKLEHSHFVTGDIILAESSSGTSLYMYDNGKVLNLSSGSYVSDPDSFLDKIFANYRFAVLRPSMTDTYDYVEPEKSQLEILIEELEELNKTSITDEEVLANFEEKIAEIDAYLEENTTESLTTSQQLIYNTAKSSVDAYKNTPEAIYADGKVWFDLKGNSRLFVPSTDEAITNRTTYDKYLPGVDFAGFVEKPTGDFAKDQAAVKNSAYGGAMFVYNAGGSTSYINLTTDEAGNYYWTVNDEKYLVRPQENVLKFVNKTVSTASILTDSEKTSRYQPLNGEKTIDVPDGKYSSIGFLGGAQLKYSKQISVTLVYGDEEVPYGNVIHKYRSTTSNTPGTMYMRNFTNSDSKIDAAHDFQVQTIPTEPTKVLTAIKVYDVGLNGSGNSGNQTCPYYIISAWGVEVKLSLEDLISELSALNTTGIKDADSYSAMKNKIAEIDTYLAENSQTLTAEQKTIYDTSTTLIKAYEESTASSNDRLKANINLAFNGNSKLFMDSTSTDFTNRATLTNYLPGLDYGARIANPTGDFAKDLAGLDLRDACEKLGCLPYILDAASLLDSKNVAYFTTKNGSVYWTIDDVDYLVKPDERVIKLVPGVQTTSVSTSATLTDTDKANYSTLAKATIDVPDGKYEKISFLASIFRTYNRYVTVKFIYEDSEVEIQQKIEAKNRSSTGSYYSKEGGLYFPRMNDASAALGKDDWHTFMPYEITTDASKILKSIEITPSNNYWNYTNNAVATSTYTYPVFVISMWAEQSIEGALSAITANTSYKDALAAVTTVDKILSENNLTTSNISAGAKLNYDLAKSIVDGAADIFELSIKQANEALSKITENSNIEEAKAAEKLYLDTLSIEGIDEDDFDTAIVSNFYAIYNTIRENTELSGEINIVYNKDALPYAEITINNPAELAGKPYKVILAYYDNNGAMLDKKILNGTSSQASKSSLEIEIDDLPSNTKTIKGFIWKDFATLIPLAEAKEATKSDKNVLKILSVGNSFSRNSTAYFYQIAKDAGYDEITIGVAYIAGSSLDTHIRQYNNNASSYTYYKNTTGTWTETSSQTLTNCIKDERWDIISIQQGSSKSGLADSYDTYLEALIEAINATKTNSVAKIIWNQTWTFTSEYSRDTAFADNYDSNQTTMYNAIINATNTKVKPFVTSGDISYIIPTGTAIQNLRENGNDETLGASTDGLHLNTLGQYTASLVWFAKITGKSIDSITYTPSATVSENLTLIKQSVNNALLYPDSVTK